MTVRELAGEGTSAAVRDLLSLDRDQVVDLAAPFVVGDPLVTVVATMLQDSYVDWYAASRVLGVQLPDPA
ncbi:hypothetical protein [Streptomyces sp. NPDC001492]